MEHHSQKRILKNTLMAGGLLAAGYISARLITAKHKESDCHTNFEKWLKSSFDQLQTKLDIPFRTSIEFFEVLHKSTHKMMKLTKKSLNAEVEELSDLRDDIENEFNHMKRRIHKLLNPSNRMVEILEKYYHEIREHLSGK